MEQGNTCSCAFCNRKIKDDGIEMWEPTKRNPEERVYMCNACHERYEKAFRSAVGNIAEWNNIVMEWMRRQRERNKLTVPTPEEILEWEDIPIWQKTITT